MNLNKQPEIQIFAIMYIRRIDLWMESAWKQWGIRTSGSLDDYIRQILDAEPLLEIVQKINASVSPGNMIIQPYEKKQLGEGLIQNFLSHVEIDYENKASSIPQRKNKTLNPGFTSDVMEVVRLSSRLLKTTRDNNLFYQMLFELLDEDYKKKPFETYRILSQAQRKQLVEVYSPVYSKLARDYLNREDGEFFYDPFPQDNIPEELELKPDLETIVPIFMALVFNLYLLAEGHKNQLQNLRRENRINKKEVSELQKQLEQLTQSLQENNTRLTGIKRLKHKIKRWLQ